MRRIPVRLDSRQARLLASPGRLAVLEAFQALGPCRVADAAARLGRRPDLVHYHVRSLRDAGFLRRLERRKAARGRPAAIYGVASPAGFAFRARLGRGLDQRSWAMAAGAVLRASWREAARAVRSGDAREDGPAPNLAVRRQKAWLRPADLRALRRRTAALEDFLRRRSRPGRGRLHAVTLVLAPA